MDSKIAFTAPTAPAKAAALGVRKRSRALVAFASLLLVSMNGAPAFAGEADAWAAKVVSRMTLEEKVALVHGIMALPFGHGTVVPQDGVAGAGYIAGVPRLGIPSIRETDASLGVAYLNGLHGATALPSGLATAASWNPQVAYTNGAVAGQEALRLGFNVLLGGGVNLARDPRNGRNFEYLGEDPLLAGILAGDAIRGTQDQHVVSTIKHFAFNDQETGRHFLSARIEEGAARESDLLAFELAIERGHPGAVMCSYNRVNTVYACENEFLLKKVLKKEWGYQGWVMSDWGAVHSLNAALNGLDQQSGEQLDEQVFFGSPLQAAVQRHGVYARRLDEMDARILRSLRAVGATDPATAPLQLDFDAGARAAYFGALQGIVLLRNEAGMLPLRADVKSIAVIGGHADLGVISGGGSSQVAPAQGPALIDSITDESSLSYPRNAMYMPSSPLKALCAALPMAIVNFNDGHDPAKAAQLANKSAVAVVFVTQWMTEGYDARDLSLPDGQDALIEAVAAANAHTIVVLETGGPVLMPWLANVAAVLEVWYPGIRGGEAITNVLLGNVNPSGRLPITFPASAEQLPRPTLTGAAAPREQPLEIVYQEGSDVGYRWFVRTHETPLFPFGFGLSYTDFSFKAVSVESGKSPHVSVLVQNIGIRKGTTVVQVYLTHSPRRQQQRLLGWSRVDLEAGESRHIDVSVERRLLADWDRSAHGWKIEAGDYVVGVGASATDLPLIASFAMPAQSLKP